MCYWSHTLLFPFRMNNRAFWKLWKCCFGFNESRTALFVPSIERLACQNSFLPLILKVNKLNGLLENTLNISPPGLSLPLWREQPSVTNVALSLVFMTVPTPPLLSLPLFGCFVSALKLVKLKQVTCPLKYQSVFEELHISIGHFYAADTCSTLVIWIF